MQATPESTAVPMRQYTIPAPQQTMAQPYQNLDASKTGIDFSVVSDALSVGTLAGKLKSVLGAGSAAKATAAAGTLGGVATPASLNAAASAPVVSGSALSTAGSAAAAGAPVYSAGASSAGALGGLGSAASAAAPLLIAGGLGYFGGGYVGKWTGGNQDNASIGGGIGATAGMLVAGPPGAIVGGIMGSFYGGLIDNKAPSNQSAGIGWNPFTGKTYGTGNKGSANLGAREYIVDGVGSRLDELQDIFGVNDSAFYGDENDTTAYRLNVDVGSRDGIQYRVEGEGTHKVLDRGDVDTATDRLAIDTARQYLTVDKGVEQKYIDRMQKSQAQTWDNWVEDIEYGLDREDKPTGTDTLGGYLTRDGINLGKTDADLESVWGQ